MINQIKLSELKSGDKVDHFCIIQRAELKNTRTGKEYFDLFVADSSKSLNAKFWDNFQHVKSIIHAGSLVKITGSLSEYMGALQIKIDSLRAAKPEDDINATDFLPKSSRNISEMMNELYDRVEAIENVYLKRLIRKIFENNNLNEFQNAPAGKSWHHSYIHGLLEHTLEIVRICDLMCDIHPVINRDLLITGAILHDFGKTQELSFESNFDYTTKGRLLGHIVIAAIEIEKNASEIEDFPKKLKDLLIHLVLSHQGKLEFASPVEPKTIEAIVLYHADELSAKTNAYKNTVLTEQHDRNGWTKFIPLAGTPLYVPEYLRNKNNH